MKKLLAFALLALASAPWRSSLSRTDNCGSACEIMWITAVQRAPCGK